ncbi:MAG: hypothetical protein HN919_09620 [Verrucomicrobia bacterium]|jgi:hypothetical protein|nr:hypothetical protein [Verrucomicrobiota bacterium]MBT7066548.1 hypothetical protein [Verrucomicrobiota bacterium]MBT7700868.1 hypothetical protein [Verrucomicrobiota bacterium]
MGSFCTVINCMDGRMQLPVIAFLQKRFHAEYVDSITAPGPNLILAKGEDLNAVDGILRCVEISVGKHGSTGIAIVGHEDCAGNPADKGEQFLHLRLAYDRIHDAFPDCEITTLWVSIKGYVEEIPFGQQS